MPRNGPRVKDKCFRSCFTLHTLYDSILMGTLNLVFLGFLDSKNFDVTIEKEKKRKRKRKMDYLNAKEHYGCEWKRIEFIQL